MTIVTLCALVVSSVAHAAPSFGTFEDSAAEPDLGATFRQNPAGAGIRYPSFMSYTYEEARVGTDRHHVVTEGSTFRLALSGAQDDPIDFAVGIVGGDDRGRWGLQTSFLPKPDDDGRARDWRLGWLSRPSPWLSMAAVLDHLNQPKLGGEVLNRTYTAALGLRPLAMDRSRAHKAGTSLTLTADGRMFEGSRWDQGELRLGATLEPVPGLVLEAAWLTQAREGRIGVSVLGLQAGLHARSAYDRDRERVAGAYTVSTHRGEDRTVFHGPHATRLGAVTVGGSLADDALRGASLLDGTSSTTAARTIHDQLQRALEDPLTRGVLLEVGGVGTMAQVEELRPRIARLREAGKPVVAYMEYGGGRGSLFLASACDRVIAAPEARFVALGLMSDKHYYRRAIADLGLRLDRASWGRYKSAYREFSVDSGPPADRESVRYQLDSAQELFVSAVSADRRLDPERLETVLDGRSWRPKDLARLGVIDSVGYREQALALLGRMARVGPKPRTLRYARRPPARVVWAVPPRIAVIYASGAIETGRSGNDLLLGPYLGSTTLVQQVESAFQRDDVGAVVLRIESPGGSSQASDLMHHALVRMKRETRKPLIVSMGSVAASGGYEIAVPGDRVYADRFTRTGSIGTLFVRPSLEGFFERHHIRQELITRGSAMRGWSLGRDWDAEMQAAADSSIRQDYDEFVERVADGRGMSPDAVDRVAQGRVWYAEDALRHGLIDEIGGLEAAVSEARRRAGVPAGERIQPAEYRRPRGSWLERVAGSFLRAQLERTLRLPEPGQSLRWEADVVEP